MTTAVSELIPQIGTISRKYSSVVWWPLWTSPLAGAKTNPMSAPTVVAAMRAIVLRAPQKPYSHAIGKFSGNPMRAESRKIFADVTEVNPSFCRFEGIHCWNPYCTMPIPRPNSSKITASPPNGPVNSWRNRLLTSFSTLSRESSPSTTTAPYRSMMA